MDLKKFGITNYGDIGTGMLGDCANDKLELYFNKTVSSCNGIRIGLYLCAHCFEIINKLLVVNPSYICKISIGFGFWRKGNSMASVATVNAIKCVEGKFNFCCVVLVHKKARVGYNIMRWYGYIYYCS